MKGLDGRRLLRALALTGVAFLVLGSGLGFVMAQGDGAGEGDLSVPKPKPGDRAMYTAKEVVLDEDVARCCIRLLWVEYEWLPERWETGSDFNERLVHPLRTTFHFSDWQGGENAYMREATYDAFTGEPVSETQVGLPADILPPTAVGDGLRMLEENGLTTQQMDIDQLSAVTHPVETQARWDGYTGQVGPCGFRMPFQGKGYSGEPVRVRANCDWPDGLEAFTFEGKGWQDTPRGLVYNLTAQEDRRFYLQFDEASPFPVRATAVLSETIYHPYTYGRYWLLERVGVVEGDGSLAYTPVAGSTFRNMPGPAPLVPRTAWGVDDQGVQHPFPLAAAYEAALQAPAAAGSTQPSVAAWLAAHPDGYLAHASTKTYYDRNGERQVSWFLVWTDGVDRLDKGVTYGPFGVDSIVLPRETGEFPVVYDTEVGFPYPDNGLVPPARVPADLPRIEDLIRRYEAISNNTANMYGFGIMCGSPGCTSVWVGVTAGRSTANIYGYFTGPVDRTVAPYSSEYANIQADDAGHLRQRSQYVASEAAVFPAFGSPGPYRESPNQQVSVDPAWTIPPGQVATGLGLAALLAGILYYFWPALKALPAVAGFSRIDDGDVLKHPKRAQILQLIEANPGIHFQELGRRLAIGRGNLDHHLRKLVDADAVTKVQSKGYTCFFPKGAVDRRIMNAAPVLRAGAGRAILEALRRNPGASSRELAALLGLAPSTVSYHLKRLREAGLVEDLASGTRLTAIGEQAAEPVGAG